MGERLINFLIGGLWSSFPPVLCKLSGDFFSKNTVITLSINRATFLSGSIGHHKITNAILDILLRRHKLSLSSRMRSRNDKNSRRELMAPASLRLRKPCCWLPGPSAWGKIPQLQAGSCLFKFCLSVYSTTLPFKLLVSTDPLERGINNEGPSNAYLLRFSLELKTEKNYPFYSVYTSIVNTKTFVFKVVKVFL